MGLLELLKKLKNKEKSHRVLVLGLKGAGKTCLLKRVAGEDIDKVCPTMGFNVRSIEHLGSFTFWDLGGSPELIAYWQCYYNETAAIIWVIDSSNRYNLASDKELLYETVSNPLLSSVPLLILNNKQDLYNPISVSQIKDFYNLSSLRPRNWAIFNCSAFDNKGIQTGLDWLSSIISLNSP